MTRSRVATFTAALLLTGIGSVSARAADPPTVRVLGPDATQPVRAWSAKLAGLKPARTSIRAAVVEVSLGSTCTLRLTHADTVACSDATSVGDAKVCWVGSGCPSPRLRARALAAAGALRLPWKTAAKTPSPLRDRLSALRRQVQQHLLRQDREATRAALGQLIGSPDVRPIDWLWFAPVLAWAGEPGEAWKIATSETLASLGPVRVAALRAWLLIGPRASGAVAQRLMKPGTACDMTTMTSAFLALRAYEAAGELGAAIRELDPSCFDAYADEAEAWTILRRLPAQREVTELALERFAGEPRLVPLEEAYLIDHGKGHVVRGRLEAAVAAGSAQPGVMKRLLTFYIQVEGRPERLARFRRLADANPTDVLNNFFTGVLLHYEKEFATSSRYLARVIGKVSDEPRLFIYLAMNAFNLGDRTSAEDYIGRAEGLDLEDPDVAYCVGEIFRDSDRGRAVRALDRYWEMTRYTSDVRSVKQKRVWRMIQALGKCHEETTPPPCPGPWEHTFDSVALGLHAPPPAP